MMWLPPACLTSWSTLLAAHFCSPLRPASCSSKVPSPFQPPGLPAAALLQISGPLRPCASSEVTVTLSPYCPGYHNLKILCFGGVRSSPLPFSVPAVYKLFCMV